MRQENPMHDYHKAGQSRPKEHKLFLQHRQESIVKAFQYLGPEKVEVANKATLLSSHF